MPIDSFKDHGKRRKLAKESPIEVKTKASNIAAINYETVEVWWRPSSERLGSAKTLRVKAPLKTEIIPENSILSASM